MRQPYPHAVVYTDTTQRSFSLRPWQFRNSHVWFAFDEVLCCSREFELLTRGKRVRGEKLCATDLLEAAGLWSRADIRDATS